MIHKTQGIVKFAAIDIELTAKELLEINGLLDQYKITGERYSLDVIKDHNLNG